ncbi:hypothetical protein BLNAU_19766 [Blattamonas nauphoetae]|uniref:Uncharacterized protein n=1 Tax=Blattamonas nauphoetae TaxID=2049346 RepID=A0ABQ9X0M2_9EUKA|nr:hypothetical protein BLNAU_19766 [Blattamonas nauphoetae]
MRKRTKTDGAKMECARTMRGMGDIAGSREDGKEWDANDGEKDPRIEYGKEEESKEDEKETERREREEQIPDIRSVMMSTISHNPEVPQIAQTVEGVLCKFGKAGGERQQINTTFELKLMLKRILVESGQVLLKENESPIFTTSLLLALILQMSNMKNTIFNFSLMYKGVFFIERELDLTDLERDRANRRRFRDEFDEKFPLPVSSVQHVHQTVQPQVPQPLIDGCLHIDLKSPQASLFAHLSNTKKVKSVTLSVEMTLRKKTFSLLPQHFLPVSDELCCAPPDSPVFWLPDAQAMISLDMIGGDNSVRITVVCGDATKDLNWRVGSVLWREGASGLPCHEWADRRTRDGGFGVGLVRSSAGWSASGWEGRGAFDACFGHSPLTRRVMVSNRLLSESSLTFTHNGPPLSLSTHLISLDLSPLSLSLFNKHLNSRLFSSRFTAHTNRSVDEYDHTHRSLRNPIGQCLGTVEFAHVDLINANTRAFIPFTLSASFFSLERLLREQLPQLGNICWFGDDQPSSASTVSDAISDDGSHFIFSTFDYVIWCTLGRKDTEYEFLPAIAPPSSDPTFCGVVVTSRQSNSPCLDWWNTNGVRLVDTLRQSPRARMVAHSRVHARLATFSSAPRFSHTKTTTTKTKTRFTQPYFTPRDSMQASEGDASALQNSGSQLEQGRDEQANQCKQQTKGKLFDVKEEEQWNKDRCLMEGVAMGRSRIQPLTPVKIEERKRIKGNRLSSNFHPDQEQFRSRRSQDTVAIHYCLHLTKDPSKTTRNNLLRFIFLMNCSDLDVHNVMSRSSSQKSPFHRTCTAAGTIEI